MVCGPKHRGLKRAIQGAVPVAPTDILEYLPPLHYVFLKAAAVAIKQVSKPTLVGTHLFSRSKNISKHQICTALRNAFVFGLKPRQISRGSRSAYQLDPSPGSLKLRSFLSPSEDAHLGLMK